MAHEPVEWGIGPHGQHEDIRDRAGVERDLAQARGPFQLLRPFEFGHQQRLDRIGAVRRYKFGHGQVLPDGVRSLER